MEHKHQFDEADGLCACGMCFKDWTPKLPPPLEQPAPVQEGVGVKQHLFKGDCPPGTKDIEGKLRYNLIPPFSLAQVARVLTKGAVKYAPDNWKKVPDANNKYVEALFRHLEKYRAGEMVDPESGEHHMAHIATNAMFLLWFDRQTHVVSGI